MFKNFVAAISASVLVTLALLFVMNLLIGAQPDAVVEPAPAWTIDWVRLPEAEEPPDALDPSPSRDFVEPPVPPLTDVSGSNEEAIGYRPPPMTPPVVKGYVVEGVTPGDGPMVLLVRPRPVYPARALQDGIEGWVVVQFDVLENGSVSNIAVVESSDRIFEKSARMAAEKFRFKPRIVQGVPQVTKGVRNKFRFHMGE
ncbi:MAG: TonB family protein [Woeseiaceae bacterium]|nr:TonB family protein [Woeseiaceae bacterium]